MANLFELLSKEDCEKIEWYIRNYAGLGGDSSDMKASLDYILRFWACNKQSLYKMLGNNLIISRKVNYSRTYEDMSDDYFDYFGTFGRTRLQRRLYSGRFSQNFAASESFGRAVV